MTTRVNYGVCKFEQCRRPVLYQGAEFCSPRCYGIAYSTRRCVLCGVGIELTQQSQVCGACGDIWGHDVKEEPERKEQNVISSFSGEYRFLSNFFPAVVLFEDAVFPTSEHAFQAAKTLDPSLRHGIQVLQTPGEAKRAGRQLQLRADWESVKVDVMLRVVRDKFWRNAELRQQLLATGSHELIEGNMWGDTTWGVCNGQGQNLLGRILMQVREELRASEGPGSRGGSPGANIVMPASVPASSGAVEASLPGPSLALARDPFSFDTETARIQRGLLAPPLACMSWCWRGNGDLLHARDARDFVAKFLQSGELLVAFNAAFDMAVICAQWPELLPLVFEVYAADRVSDPMLREKLRDIAEGSYLWGEDEDDERVRLNYSLEEVARRRCRIKLEKGTWQLRFGELIPYPLEQWPLEAKQYAVLDSYAGREVWLDQERENQERLIREPGVDYFEDEFRQSRAAFWLHLMGCWGFHTSPGDVRAFAQKTQQNYERLRDELLASGIVREQKTKKKDTGLVEVRYVKKKAPVQLLVAQEKRAKGLQVPITKTAAKKLLFLEEALERESVPARRAALERKADKCLASITTDKDVCSRSDHPLLKKYAEFSHYEHMLKSDVPLLQMGTYYPIQAKFDLANSGRTRGSVHHGKGNTQNWSTSNGMRECAVPRLRKIYAIGDYSGFELRTWSQVCLWMLGQTRMGQMLNAGLDPHLEMASRILHISYEQAGWELSQDRKGRVYFARQTGKVGDFGLPGGLGPDKLVEYGRKNYNVIITRDEAYELKEFWLHAWPEASKYLEASKQFMNSGQKRVKFYVSNRYRGDLNFTEYSNGWFQALAADAAKNAGFLIARACYADPTSVLFGSRPIMFIHDEFVLEVDDDERASDKAHELGRLMVAGASPFLPDVPPVVEPLLSRVWSKRAEPVHSPDGRLVPWEMKRAA